jgi:hypothetical protein
MSPGQADAQRRTAPPAPPRVSRTGSHRPRHRLSAGGPGEAWPSGPTWLSSCPDRIASATSGAGRRHVVTPARRTLPAWRERGLGWAGHTAAARLPWQLCVDRTAIDGVRHGTFAPPTKAITRSRATASGRRLAVEVSRPGPDPDLESTLADSVAGEGWSTGPCGVLDRLLRGNAPDEVRHRSLPGGDVRPLFGPSTPGHPSEARGTLPVRDAAAVSDQGHLCTRPRSPPGGAVRWALNTTR